VKVALCLHGYFDSQKNKSSLGLDGYQHIKKHILDKSDVDIYIHSWDIENEQTIRNIYSEYIKDSIFQEQIDFQPLFLKNGLQNFNSHGTPFWNVFSQYYSVQKSFELMIKSEIPYDCVIKGRFDLGRINRNSSGMGGNNPYAVQCINFNPNFDMEHFYMADWQYLDTEGPADMWFYSNLENMKKFNKVFDILSNDIKVGSSFENWAGHRDGGMVNAIKGWKWFLIKVGLWDNKKTLPTYWE
jgi:hypothetical protein